MSRAITLSVLRSVVDVVSGDADSNFDDQKQPEIVPGQTDAGERSIQSREAPKENAGSLSNESDSVPEPVEAQDAVGHSRENSIPTPVRDTSEGGPVPETGSNESGSVPTDELTPEGPVVPRITMRTAVSMVIQKALRLFGLNHPGSWHGSVESDVGGTKDVAAGESLASEVGAIIEGSLLADASGITIEASITTAPEVDEEEEEREREQRRLDEEREQRKRLKSIEEATKLVKILALRWYRETVIGPSVLEEPKKEKDTRLVKTPTILQVFSPPPRMPRPPSRPTSARQIRGIQVYLAPLLGPVRETSIKESSPNFVIRGIKGTTSPPKEETERRKISLRTAASEIMAKALRLYLERYKQTLSQHSLMVHQIASKQKEEEEKPLTKEQRGERLLDVLRRMSVRALRIYADETRETVQPDDGETVVRIEYEDVMSTDDEYFSETIPDNEMEKLHPDVQLRMRLSTLTGVEFGMLSEDNKQLVNLAQTADDAYEKLTEDEKAQVLLARKTVTEIPDIKKVLQEKRVKRVKRMRKGKRAKKRRVRKAIKTFEIPVEHELTVGRGRFRSHALGQPSPRRGIHPPSQRPHPPQHLPKTHHARPRPKQKRVPRRPAQPAHPAAKGRVGAKPIAKPPDTASLESDEGKKHKKLAKMSDKSDEENARRSSKTEDEILAREFASIHGVEFTDYRRGSKDHKLSLLTIIGHPGLLKKVLRRRKRRQRCMKHILAKATFDVEDSVSLRIEASDTDSLMSLSEEDDISEMELAEADRRLSEEGVDLERVICKC